MENEGFKCPKRCLSLCHRMFTKKLQHLIFIFKAAFLFYFVLFVCYVFSNFSSKCFMNMLSIDTGLLLSLTFFFLLNILVKTIFRVCRPSGEVNDNIICLHPLYLSRYN